MRPRRLVGFSHRGPHRYFLTFCTHDRARLFTSAALVGVVRTELLRAASECGFDLVAYCFMPDHLHLLVAGVSAESDLRAFVRCAKQRSAYMVSKLCGVAAWQAGYFERVLRADDDLVDVVRYILQNPVRAGLVRSPVDYPFLGSTVVTLKQLLESSAWKPR